MNNQVEQAVQAFRTLLEEQIARSDAMTRSRTISDFHSAKRIVVGVCLGDGIGPIIMREAQRVIEYMLADDIKSGRIVIKKIEDRKSVV